MTLTDPISMRTPQQKHRVLWLGSMVLAGAGFALGCGRVDVQPAPPDATRASQFVSVPGPPVYRAHSPSLTDLCPERLRDSASTGVLVRAVANVTQERQAPGDSSVVTEATAIYILESAAGRPGAVIDSVHVDCRTLRRIDPSPEPAPPRGN